MSPVHRDGPEHRDSLRTKDGRVVRIRLPEELRDGHEIKATTEAVPKPPQADDPRPSAVRNVPPFGGA